MELEGLQALQKQFEGKGGKMESMHGAMDIINTNERTVPWKEEWNEKKKSRRKYEERIEYCPLSRIIWKYDFKYNYMQ